MQTIEERLGELVNAQDLTTRAWVVRWIKIDIETAPEDVRRYGEAAANCDALRASIADDWNAMVEALKRAEQLAQIASDWDLGTDGEVEIDDEWVPCYVLRHEFTAILARVKGEE